MQPKCILSHVYYTCVTHIFWSSDHSFSLPSTQRIHEGGGKDINRSALSLSHTHTLSIFLSHTHKYSLYLSLFHAHILFLSLSLSHTHTHSISLSLTHTHTHSLSLSFTYTFAFYLSLSHTHILFLSLSLFHTHILFLGYMKRGQGHGVASVSRIDKIIGLFCKRAL